MQLRHIRPGSLEWQESKAEEIDLGSERLTPEETQHLRSMSENEEATVKQTKQPPIDVQ